MKKKFRQHVNKIKIAALGICFSLAVAPLVVISIMDDQSVTKVDAADYSGVSSGFSKGADGSVSASFTVTNNGLDMKGWLLCLFESKLNNFLKVFFFSDLKIFFFEEVNTFLSVKGELTVFFLIKDAPLFSKKSLIICSLVK